MNTSTKGRVPVPGSESNKVSLETIEFSLSETIHAASDDVAPIAAENGSVICCLLDPSLPERAVGDPHRLQSILRDLISIVITNSHASQVKLAVFPIEQRPPDLQVMFELTATPEIHVRSTGTPAESDAASGEALIVRIKESAQSLGGDAGIQVQRGLPPTFWCRLPIQQLAPKSVTWSTERAPTPKPNTGKYPVRILMAEDNSINQRVGKLILQKAGYIIDLVGDGSEALAAHQNAPYDMILMDCQMPTMDGFEATKLIRSVSSPRQPIIIAVTANALVGERERCLSAGMDDYLSKPFQAEQLVAIVEKWAEKALRR